MIRQMCTSVHDMCRRRGSVRARAVGTARGRAGSARAQPRASQSQRAAHSHRPTRKNRLFLRKTWPFYARLGFSCPRARSPITLGVFFQPSSLRKWLKKTRNFSRRPHQPAMLSNFSWKIYEKYSRVTHVIRKLWKCTLFSVKLQ